MAKLALIISVILTILGLSLFRYMSIAQMLLVILFVSTYTFMIMSEHKEVK